jgi:hypothetical protein
VVADPEAELTAEEAWQKTNGKKRRKVAKRGRYLQHLLDPSTVQHAPDYLLGRVCCYPAII